MCGGRRIATITAMATTAALALSSAMASPAPRGDVGWSDAGTHWLDMFVRDVSGESRPHLTLSSYIQNLAKYEIHTGYWTGDDWETEVVRQNLTAPPYAVTSWRSASPSGNYEIVYGFYAGSPKELTWSTWNVATSTWGTESAFGEVSASAVRPAIAVRSDGDPAVVFFADDAGFGPENTYYARWDTGTGVVDVEELDDCTGDWPTLILDPADDDTIYVSCREDKGAGSYDIRYVFGDASTGTFTSEVVFGASDSDAWAYPAMAMMGSTPVVVAYNVDEQQVWLRRRSGGSWQAPVLMIDDIDLEHLEVDARSDGAGGGRAAVVALTDLEGVWIDLTVTGGSSTVGDARRLDLEPDAGTACEASHTAASVALSADGETSLAGWITNAQATTYGNTRVHTARHVQFDMDDTLDWGHLPDAVPVLATSLALDADGGGWSCYYDESTTSPPEIDLYLKYRDGSPIVVDTDTGYGASAYARGCDVAVAPDGTIGVLWHATEPSGGGTVDTLNYRERVAGAFGAIENLADGLGPVENNGHLALTFDDWSDAHAVFARDTGTVNPWVGHRGVGWTLDQADTYAGGTYPDIVYPSGSAYAHVSYVLTGLSTVTYAKETAGTPWVYNDLATSTVAFDTSMSTRVVGIDTFIAVGWSNFSKGQVEYAYVDTAHTGGGAATVEVIDDTSGQMDFTSIEIESDGEVIATYHKLHPMSSTTTLRVADVRRYSGGRASPAAPVAGRVLCDIAETEAGTDLELDAHDNPRVLHRPDLPSGMSTADGLQYTTRP